MSEELFWGIVAAGIAGIFLSAWLFGIIQQWWISMDKGKVKETGAMAAAGAAIGLGCLVQLFIYGFGIFLALSFFKWVTGW